MTTVSERPGTVEGTGDASATQRRILEVAVAIIDESGADALRVGDVAARSHLAPPTLYYYFSNRHRLICAAQARRLELVLQADDGLLEELLAAAADGDKLRGLRAAERHNDAMWSDEMVERSWTIIEILNVARRDEELREEVQRILTANLTRRAEAVVLLQRQGWIDPTVDPKAWAAVYMGALFGRVLTDLAPEVHPDSDEMRAMIERINPAAILPGA